MRGSVILRSVNSSDVRENCVRMLRRAEQSYLPVSVAASNGIVKRIAMPQSPRRHARAVWIILRA